MKVYDTLRGELMADELIAGQPSFSAEYMRRVSCISPTSAFGILLMFVDCHAII